MSTAATSMDHDASVVETSDLLRPGSTKATGLKPWVWYAVIAVVTIVSVVYLTGMFAGPPKPASADDSATSNNVPATEQAAQKFRYAGTVDSSTNGAKTSSKSSNGSSGSNSVTPGGAAGATGSASPLPLPTVPPENRAYGSVSQPSVVPDVSEASGAYRRIALPTPAPGEMPGTAAGTAIAAEAQPASHGISIVYGAPETSTASVHEVAPGVPVGAVRQQPALPTAAPALVAQMTAAGGLPGQSDTETMAGRRHAPTSRYMLVAGTKIYCASEGYIQSDMPGPVSCRLTAPAIDSLTGQVLVPAGSEVLGYYGGASNDKATALTIGWTRLIFPDRSSFPLDKLPALNEDGHMGVSGTIDDHRGRLFRTTFIGAILATAAQRFLGVSNSTTNIYVSSSHGQQPYAAGAQMVLDLANKLNARDGDLPPTIVIPANSPVEVYVDRDMIFDGPYQPMAATHS